MATIMQPWARASARMGWATVQPTMALVALTWGLVLPALAAPATKPADQPATSTAPAADPPASTPAQPASHPEPGADEPSTSPAPVQASRPAPGPVASAANDYGLEIRDGEVVVFLGDDLTDTPRPTASNSFPMLVETFLAVRYPELQARYINVGWSGDTVSRALLRLDRDVLSHKPTMVVVCLGLNDPEYLPVSDRRLAAYRKDLLALVSRCKDAGARVSLMSAPSVDEEKGRKARIQRGGRPGTTDLQAIAYNATLARYAAAMAEVAQETNSSFVDWYAKTSAARARGRQADPGFSLTSNGLVPTDRAHAMAASALLEAWGAKPIEAAVELTWATGEVRVSSHLADAAVARAEINAAGERRMVLKNLPLTWPMAGGQAGYLEEDWEAADLCRFLLRVPDAPEQGVVVKLEWPQGPAAHDEPISPERLREGFNLASTEALNVAKEITELFQFIGTKNYYHYGTWRKLALSPPREAELVEAHRKLIEAWNCYVSGTERIIHNQPKTFDLHLVLSEAVTVEQLPTSSPQPARPTVPAVAEASPEPESPAPATKTPAADPPAQSQPAAPATQTAASTQPE